MENIPTITTLVRDCSGSKDWTSNSPLLPRETCGTHSVSFQPFPRVLSLEIPEIDRLENRHTPHGQTGLSAPSDPPLPVCGLNQKRTEEDSIPPPLLYPLSRSDTLGGNSPVYPVRVPLLTSLPSLYPFLYSPVSPTSLRPPTRVSNDDDLLSRSLELHGQQSRRGSL